MNPDQNRPQALVRRWVEQLVVGEGLCPFAAGPIREGRVRITALEAADGQAVMREFLAEVEHLLAVDASVVETTLMVVPNALGDFDDYLDVLARLEEALQALGLEDALQLASFHPDYRFEGEPAESPGNYTNRSPYPVFHLIRQSSISRALQGWDNPEEIPERNKRRMQELGIEYLKRISAGSRGRN